MNYEIAFWSFVILMILHIIADFWFGGNRRLHYFIALNPLHWLIDISPLRRHHNYMTSVFGYTSGYEIKQSNYVEDMFWRWLALDQLIHLLSNLLLAWFLGMIL